MQDISIIVLCAGYIYNCIVCRLSRCWSSSLRSSSSTSESRLRSPRCWRHPQILCFYTSAVHIWSYQILYYNVSDHICEGVLHHLLWRLGVLLCSPHLLSHLGVDGDLGLKSFKQNTFFTSWLSWWTAWGRGRRRRRSRTSASTSSPLSMSPSPLPTGSLSSSTSTSDQLCWQPWN